MHYFSELSAAAHYRSSLRRFAPRCAAAIPCAPMIRRLLPYARPVVNVALAARQVLAELELTSVIPARAVVAAVTTNPPESAPPSGEASPADHWRVRFERASDAAELAELIARARDELCHLRRRALPVGPWSTLDDLAERVLEGEGLPPGTLAYELRCTPRMVRRLRLAAGREGERGRRVELEALEPRALIGAGMSYRAVAAVLAVPRSTLHDRLNRSIQP